MPDASPPGWLIRTAVAGVWLYEGLWCKWLHGQPHEFAVVAAVPRLGARDGAPFLLTLGGAEIVIAVWAMIAQYPVLCATAQTVLLILLNTSGLVWARHLIPDPAGMVVRNASFLVLVWVGAGLAPGA